MAFLSPPGKGRPEISTRASVRGDGDTRPEIYNSNKVRFELMRRLGHFVTESSEHNAEYSPWFIPRGKEVIARFDVPIDEYLRRCDRIVDEFERE